MALAVLLVGLVVAATLLFQVGLLGTMRQTDVLLGKESKREFLERRLINFGTLQYVQANFSPDERVLMMWDGTGYYCGASCLPDADQSNWTRLIDPTSTPTTVARQLKAMGVSHLLYNGRDAQFFVDHDPRGRHRRALEFFQEEFLPACTEELHRDGQLLLVRITCL